MVLAVPFLLSLAEARSGEEDEELQATHDGTASVRLLGVNDFHGHLESPGSVNGREVGGVAHLAAYLDRYGRSGSAIRVHAGDMVGASPMISGYFHDEPAVRAMNLMSFDVGTVGNHELDEGAREMLRLVEGGRRVGSETSGPDYPGAGFPYLAANTVRADTGQTLLPPYRVLERNGVRIGFIGVTTPETAEIIHPGFAASLRFLDISETVDRYARELRREGVEAIVVLAHAGGWRSGSGTEGEIVAETAQMTDAVDVVVAGHTHARLNARIGDKVVVEAGKYGAAFSVVDLEVDRASGDVEKVDARIVTTYNDEISPNSEAAALVEWYRERAEPVAGRVIGVSRKGVSAAGTAAGESPLGDLAVDAQRAAGGTDFAFLPSGRLRSSIAAGPVTYGELYDAKPFGDRLVEVELDGARVRRLLEQQYTRQRTRKLQVSGLRYTYDPSGPFGNRITEIILPDGSPVDRDSTYTVTVNGFLAEGGGGFTVLREGGYVREVGEEPRALVEHVRGLPQPFDAPDPAEERRITIEGR